MPNKPVIDREHCTYFKKGKCGVREVLPPKAIRFDQQDEIIEDEVGAIVVATGFKTMARDRFGEYGYGKYKDVIDGLQFERLASASGPTGGEMKRPSDGKVPKTVVFIACAGCRDPQKGIQYCSKICCMYTAKHAMLYKHKVHDGQAHVFYMDVRAAGKGYEEFVRRAIEEDGVNYVRGRVSRIYEEDGQLVVKGADTLLGESRSRCGPTWSCSPRRSRPRTERKSWRRSCTSATTRTASSPRRTRSCGRSRRTPPASCSRAPARHRGHPGVGGQASGAAVKVCGLFSQPELTREPIVAVVDRQAAPVWSTCVGCFLCQSACPYQAIEADEIRARDGALLKTVASVNPGLCQGCGTCVATCRTKSIDLQGYTNEQVYAEVMSL